MRGGRGGERGKEVICATLSKKRDALANIHLPESGALHNRGLKPWQWRQTLDANTTVHLSHLRGKFAQNSWPSTKGWEYIHPTTLSTPRANILTGRMRFMPKTSLNHISDSWRHCHKMPRDQAPVVVCTNAQIEIQAPTGRSENMNWLLFKYVPDLGKNRILCGLCDMIV